MNVEHERRALAYVEAALDWPAEERMRRAAADLAGEPEVHAIVRDLLAAADRAGCSLPTLLPLGPLVDDPAPPDRIGPYRVGALLGAGGMGRVFRGERADGLFEQHVAIKLMRRTLLAGAVAAQFARERRILAQLRHRNIAALYDGGVTVDEQSYFVMELVEGSSIVEWANERRLAVRERVQLFLQVCGAVQHAHAHLVVHADLKPSNVIVTADGTAKLLDFGVAHVIADARDDAQRPIGLTREYASPARRAGAAPTTSDDVYSLGVLLDALLADAGPVPSDLRAAIGRARANAAEIRYSSVGAFADELRRWLGGYPVEAHAAGWRYAIAKYVGRHRVAAATAGAALLLLSAAAVALAVLYVAAERARERAEQRFTDAREVSRWVLYDVYDRLEALPRSLQLRRDIAQSGQTYLNRLAGDPNAPPDVRLEVAEGLRRLALVQGMPGSANLAQPKLARVNLDRAIGLLGGARSGAATQRRARDLQLARLQLASAGLASATELDFPRALAALDEVDRLVAGAIDSAPRDVEARALRLDAIVQRSAVLQWQGDYPRSIDTAAAAITTARADAAERPGDRDAVLRLARLLDIYAESLYFAGRPRDAVPSYREQLALVESLAAREPTDVRRIQGLARAAWALGSTLVQLGEFGEAEQVMLRSRDAAQTLRALDPDDATAARTFDIAEGVLAQALAGQRRYAEAIPLLAQRYDSISRRAAAAPDDWNLLRDTLLTAGMIADVLADAGREREACAHYAEYLRLVGRLRAAGRWSKLDDDYSLPIVTERRKRHCGAT